MATIQTHCHKTGQAPPNHESGQTPFIPLCAKGYRYSGVPIRKSSYLIGDKTVVNSGSLPHAKLHKRHTRFSYQCVCEAIASGGKHMVALDGETPSSLVVAIELILGTVMYEARSHYHQVLEDVVTYQVFTVLHIESQFISV